MSLGTRFRTKPAATSSLKAVAGAVLIGAVLVGGSLGATVAQDASPAASPSASPVAVAPWIQELVTDEFPEVEGDSATVGVTVDDAAEPPLALGAATFETRPFVEFEATNNNDTDVIVVLLTAPDEFDASGFTLPQDVAELPEGVTPFSAFAVPAGSSVTAVYPDLAPGTYVVATTNGLATTAVVNEQTEVEVPDIFATPEG